MAEPEGGHRVETDLEVVAGVTDRGLIHERNEDAMALGRLPDGTVAAVVCDGVSTSLDPQQASRLAADTALDVLLTSTSPARERVDAAVATAGAKVAALGRAGDAHAPSCTLVCALVLPDEIAIGWVGDSRAYWLAPPGSAEPARRVTDDHSWAAEMVASGVLDTTAAMDNPRAHAITRWLGAGGSAEAGITTLDPHHRGAVLLCTDGLWKYLPEAADLAAVALPRLADGGPLAAASALTAVALDAGGRDNVTTVVIVSPAG
ncbi:MAG TPA: protein phosphatase 2C domain-containing protein [Pseudonocardia sp.]|jgi:serine/threonine protein phosphatase PrpC|uniref:PP2C family protein-serine/threonine phosphatase n=1 Tax=Pseudonocardia sp. TaxID=60912 RepID=UPI002B4B24D7|nr:protein phosphatase 2C domain-containing protein [Pseudonocardia sp.]HLU57428.1 protein phosphatase 2C domain-containing protein [Pseudonocardia sp.]